MNSNDRDSLSVTEQCCVHVRFFNLGRISLVYRSCFCVIYRVGYIIFNSSSFTVGYIDCVCKVNVSFACTFRVDGVSPLVILSKHP